VTSRAAFDFLCDLLSFAPLEVRRPALDEAIRRNRIAWPELVRLASDHQVSPGILAALERADLTRRLPSDLIDYFDGMATLNRQRNEQIRDTALALADRLGSIGVAPVFLKGAADLLTGLRRDPGERLQLDIDVLVPRDRLDECVNRLRRDGFESQLHTNSPLSHHAAPLWRPGDAAEIELHTQPLAYPFDAMLPAAELLATAQRVVVAGHAVLVPSPAARVIHVVAHAQLTDLGLAYGRVELRQLLDVGHLALRHGAALDWQAIAARFARQGHGEALAVHLLAAARFLQAPVPVPALSWATRVLFARLRWQSGTPRLAALEARLLRPFLLLGRSLSHAALRRQLVLNLADRQWLQRHLRQLLR
jgi:hypothetical protein